MRTFSLSKNASTYTTRAKYYYQPDGTMRLASIQQFSIPKFTPSGYEARKKIGIEPPIITAQEIEIFEDGGETADVLPSNIERATRRARKNAFDMIMCNSDLDMFCTFTYSPQAVEDKASYDECYGYLSPWLSNRVQRNGLKYVCVPELTKKGDIHFHAIMNKSALKLEQAFYESGRAIKHNGKPIYNIVDWKRGFTTAEEITRMAGDQNEREAVSKYIFKYMGKQEGQKIGGRYCLIGGELRRPIYAYGDSPDEFFDGSACRYVGDVVKIRVEDIRSDGRIFYKAQKTGKEGLARVPPSLAKKLRENSHGGEWCFPSPKKSGEHITRQAVYTRIKSAAKKAGVSEFGISPHSFRKVFAVKLFNNSDIGTVKEALQHTSATVTELYALADWLTGENAKKPLLREDIEMIVDAVQRAIDKKGGYGI